MRRYARVVLTVVPFLFAPAALLAAQMLDLMKVEPQSRVWVEGTSTTRDFRCEAAVFDARIDANRPAASSAIMAGEKAVSSVQLQVSSSRLDCGNGTMNQHMWKALKTSEHPVISFELSAYEMTATDAGIEVTLTGPLSLGGVKKDIQMTAIASDAGNGVLRVSGVHQIRMTEFGLKPPSLMLGTLRVNERIQVNFDLFLKG